MKAILTLAILLTMGWVQAAPAPKAVIITMEIPPFMSPKLPHQGAAIYGLREIFKKAGYELELRFIPVPRTKIVEIDEKDVHGFFPSFADENFKQNLVLSKLFYQTPWVIVERVDKPIRWKVAEDLLKYKGGNVAGYALRSQVASAYKNKMDHLESAPDDSANILKLLHKRVDFIFIDLNAFKYIAATNPDIKPLAHKLQVNEKIVAMNRYGVSFKNTQASLKIMADFNKYADEKIFTEMVVRYIEDQGKNIEKKPSP